MKIGGLEKFTLTDYPGEISCIVFTVGCNFRCPFCHNTQLVTEEAEKTPEKEIFDFLRKRKGQLEGVVVTGGEPTVQSDLPGFLEKVKEMGYKVKLDTNGSISTALKEVLDKDLVDYVAMDVKASLSNYDAVSGVEVETKKIKESIELTMGEKSYEFRTTAVPGLIDEKEIKKISKEIEGAKNYFIQQFEPRNTLKEKYLKMESLSEEKLKKLRDTASKYVRNCEIRNV